MKRALQATKPYLWTATGIFVLLWLIGVLWAPYRELTKQQLSKLDKGTNALRLVILERLPNAPGVRIEPRGGNNVDVYLSEFTFESLPYPDRRDFVRAAGQSWCKDLGGTEASDLFLASVKIRDMRTGDVLASYNCALRWWAKRATGAR